MENPVEYLNQRMKEQMKVVVWTLESGPSMLISSLNNEFPLYSTRAKTAVTEEEVYNNLAKLIVGSTTPFSITNATCLENALDAYKIIIPLIKDKDIKTLAVHCSFATEHYLTNIDKISKIKNLNEKLGFKR